jgi:succinate dehydrogenase/fumarate reductase flavoprotein subunit
MSCLQARGRPSYSTSRPGRIRARKAVIFATGGFTHNKELRQNFLNVPVYGGCAANTNEGDFVAIASAVSAQLRNMNYAWMCPVPLEKAVAGRRSRTAPTRRCGRSVTAAHTMWRW